MSSRSWTVPAVPVNAAVALCAILLLSCSVKEDRTECPCFLTLDLGGIGTAALMQQGLDSLVVGVVAGTDFYEEAGLALRDNVQEYNLAVPKEQVDVMVACGVGRGGLSTGGFTIPEGDECPAVYLFTDSFMADEGELRRTVSLHKHYCVLSVSMKTSYNTNARPYRIHLEGNVSGCSMDGSPAEGFFSCFSSPSSGGLCHLNIPRQRDGSLMLEVHFQDSGEIRSFPVGEYILESGYDWSAPDLEDIRLEMDFSRSGLTFNISGWKKTLTFEITF